MEITRTRAQHPLFADIPPIEEYEARFDNVRPVRLLEYVRAVKAAAESPILLIQYNYSLNEANKTYTARLRIIEGRTELTEKTPIKSCNGVEYSQERTIYGLSVTEARQVMVTNGFTLANAGMWRRILHRIADTTAVIEVDYKSEDLRGKVHAAIDGTNHEEVKYFRDQFLSLR